MNKRWHEYEIKSYRKMNSIRLTKVYDEALFERQISIDLLYRHIEKALEIGRVVKLRKII